VLNNKEVHPKGWAFLLFCMKCILIRTLQVAKQLVKSHLCDFVRRIPSRA